MAILSGGELTVTVRGNGRGGPNQEYALALADCCRTPGHSRWQAIPMAPTAARAGHRPRRRGDRPSTFAAMRRLASILRLSRQQRRHGIFVATGDLLLTGPTLTNVNDIRVILVDPT